MLIFVMLVAMNPSQPGPQAQYDFILNPQQPKRSPGFGGSMKNRIFILAGLAIIIILAVSIISSIISRASRGPVDKLKEIAAQQTEIIRVADIGQTNSKTSDGRGFAATVNYSVGTDRQKLQPLLEASGVKMKPEELAKKKNDSADSSLEAAAANNRYDEQLKEILNTYLQDYLVMLKDAYDSGAGPNTKAELERSYNSAAAILGTE